MRGGGLAPQMRTGVLALAFDHLGAEVAVSSAVLGNAPSLAVSRRLRYADNGFSRIVTPTGPATLQHVRLTREVWAGSGRSVQVEGVARCLPWFGIS